MKLYIDADGCPVVDKSIKTAKGHNVPCIIICDTAHIFEKPGVQTITVSQGADSVDFTLVNMLSPGDVVVTQDYGLAAMCLARGAIPLSQDGMVYSDANIDALLHRRHTAQKIRRGGGRLRGPAKRTAEQDESFVRALEQILAGCPEKMG